MNAQAVSIIVRTILFINGSFQIVVFYYNDLRLHQPKTTVADVAGGRARGGRGGKETSLFSATRTIAMRLVSSIGSGCEGKLGHQKTPISAPKTLVALPISSRKVVPLNYCLSPASNAIGWIASRRLLALVLVSLQLSSFLSKRTEKFDFISSFIIRRRRPLVLV